MPSAASESAHAFRRRVMRVWLWTVAGLIFAMVILGGATRLTISGLSIVEWQPVVGVIPPLNAESWEAEFAKYRQIPQYQKINPGMSLGEFKVIYWWEWSHRLLGRIIGAAFLLPFLFFLWKRWLEPGLQRRLWFIFGLGAFQGIVGWWMVASGLSERVRVSQYRLAFHLTLACIIFAVAIWTAQRLSPQRLTSEASQPKRITIGATALVLLVLCQIYVGGLLAGLDAGLIYNTWPLIDGSIVPSASQLFFQSPWWQNFFENPLTVQFLHRTIAYALWIGAILHLWDLRRGSVRLKGEAAAVTAVVTVQAAVGITTLLYQAPIALALLHQATAVAVLTFTVVHAERLAHQGVGWATYARLGKRASIKPRLALLRDRQ